MNAMTTIDPSAAAQVLILNARDSYSDRNPVSEGAVALASWLAEHDAEPVSEGLVMFLGGIANVTRMLSDDMMPGNEWGEEMGRMTDGAVTPNLWRRPYRGEVARVDFVGLHGKRASSVIVDEFESRPGPSGLLCEVMGMTGELQPGPLYVAIADPLTPHAFVVTGMGQATVFDAARAQAMRTALADGLKQIGADA